MGSLLRLFVRTRRSFLLIWLLSLIGMMAMIPGAYKGAYPNIEDIESLLRDMTSNPSMNAFYGSVPDPISFGALSQWEMGQWLLILGGVMSVMIAVRLTRASEEDGTAELIAASGFHRLQPLAAATIVLLGTCLTLGAGVAAVMMINGAFIDGISIKGSIVLGIVTALSTSTFGAIALVFSQFTDSARTARSLSLGVMALSYLVRAWADVRFIPWLRWFSPFGWRDVMGPYSTNRFWPAGFLFIALVALLALAFVFASRRDLGASAVTFTGVSRREAHSVSGDRGFGPIGLRFRLERATLLWWGISIVVFNGLLLAMTGEMVGMLDSSPATKELISKMIGADVLDNMMAFMFLDMMGMWLGILLACAAVQVTMSVHSSEASGILAHELAAGSTRKKPFLISWAIGFLGISLATVIAGAVGAYTSTLDVPGIGDEAFWAIVGLLPAIFALSAFALFAIAVVPKMAWLAWIPVAYSGFISFFGGLFELPNWMLETSAFAHNPQVLFDTNTSGKAANAHEAGIEALHGAAAGATWDLTGTLVLVAIGVVCIAVSMAFVGKRDVLAG
ncbi:ABC transporter permease [Corynebacterium sp. H78]|uniref:ABC transporter permease n=1 Tax=Corynebacterium sp. H78 TaxID=3133417 RepID=UPI003097EA82